MLIYLFALTTGLLAWMIVKPHWMPPPPDIHLPKKLPGRVEALMKKYEEEWNVVKAVRSRKAGQGALLKEWALNANLASSTGLLPAQAQALEEFKDWVSSLTAPQSDSIVLEIERFCAKQGIELGWILDDAGLVDIRAALSTLVMYYGMAVQHRMATQPLAALRAWENDPLSRRNRDFGSRLYALLATEGHVTLPANMLLAPEKERTAHVVNTIKEELSRNRPAIISLAAQALADQQSGL